MSQTRRLAAILAADVAGYSRLMGADEEGTLAREALRSAPDDPEVLAHAAIVFGYFGEDINAAIALVDRALTLNPSFARGW